MGEVLAGGSAAVTMPADNAEPPAAVVALPADGQRGAADVTVSALQQPAGDHHSHRCRHPTHQDAQVDHRNNDFDLTDKTKVEEFNINHINNKILNKLVSKCLKHPLLPFKKAGTTILTKTCRRSFTPTLT